MRQTALVALGAAWRQKQLDEFSKKHNEIGRKLVEHESEKRQLSIRMGDMLRDFTIIDPPSGPVPAKPLIKAP